MKGTDKMFVYSVRLTYTGNYGDDHLTEHYYVTAPNGCLAVDKALTTFLNDNGLNFDDDIDNIEWTYCVA